MKNTPKTENLTNQNGQESAVILDNHTKIAIQKAEEMKKLFEILELENLERSKNIVPDYYEFTKEGDCLRAVFLGINDVTMNDRNNIGEKKIVKSAFLTNKKGNYICSSASLVKNFELYGKIGSAYDIEYLGEEKTTTGNKVKTFDIFLLL
jgi:hypothetical protein